MNRPRTTTDVPVLDSKGPSRRAVLKAAFAAVTGVPTAAPVSGGQVLATEPDAGASPPPAPVPYQGLLENEGHAYQSWGLTHETRPADLTIPRQLVRTRFMTKYYAQFLG